MPLRAQPLAGPPAITPSPVLACYPLPLSALTPSSLRGGGPPPPPGPPHPPPPPPRRLMYGVSNLFIELNNTLAEWGLLVREGERARPRVCLGCTCGPIAGTPGKWVPQPRETGRNSQEIVGEKRG